MIYFVKTVVWKTQKHSHEHWHFVSGGQSVACDVPLACVTEVYIKTYFCFLLVKKQTKTDSKAKKKKKKKKNLLFCINTERATEWKAADGNICTFYAFLGQFTTLAWSPL